MTVKIDKFENFAIKILGFLKEQFPFPVTIEANTLSLNQSDDIYIDGDLVKREETEDEKYLAATFNWLRINGYVTGHCPSGSVTIENAILSEKGLLKIGVKLKLDL
ncbi:hypothetical protein ACSC9T_08905 [Pseudomonas putida]|uniref:hypothetical protein n=1 Tax=Pseudomonas putida TaxID=303 RepID=UPI003F4AB7B1